jgi:hypothetical protein
MMTSSLLGRRGDGSAAVRGWVGFYTLGLPRPMRERRQAEVAGDLADETLDAIRHGDRSILFRQRLVRLLYGIPSDLSWRFLVAPGVARQLYGPAPWVPLNRWTLALTGVVAMLAGGGLAIVTLPTLAGQVRPDLWPGWGPVGFAIGSAVVLGGVLGSVFWPRLGALVIVPGALIGLLAAPWLWGSWLMAVIAGAARAYQADEALR